MKLDQESRNDLCGNRFRNDFVCPRCGVKHNVDEAIVKTVETSNEVVGFIRHGGTASSTIRQKTFHKIRFCPDCVKKMKYKEYFWWGYFIVPCLIVNTIFISQFFSSPNIFGKPESFWGVMEQRDVWSLIGWILGIGFVGMTILLIIKLIIGQFEHNDKPSLQQAIKDNSLVI